MCTDCGDTEQVKYSNTPNLKLVEQPLVRQSGCCRNAAVRDDIVHKTPNAPDRKHSCEMPARKLARFGAINANSQGKPAPTNGVTIQASHLTPYRAAMYSIGANMSSAIPIAGAARNKATTHIRPPP